MSIKICDDDELDEDHAEFSLKCPKIGNGFICCKQCLLYMKCMDRCLRKKAGCLTKNQIFKLQDNLCQFHCVKI